MQATSLAIGLLLLCAGAGSTAPQVGAQNEQPGEAARATFSVQELYDLTTRFFDNFMFPEDIDQARAINSSILSEDCIGQVDLTGTWVGRELNTEYIYGLFANLGQAPKALSLVPVPVGYEILHFASGGGDVVSVAVRLQSNFTSVGEVLPLELGLWMVYNEQGEVSQYDATFRYWQYLTDTVNGLYVQKTGLQPSTALLLEEGSLREQVCSTAELYCTGNNQQYSNFTDCVEFLRTIPLGESYALGFDTLACRSVHIHMLPLRPSIHCNHIGRSEGNSACYDRSYVDFTTENPFMGPSFMPPGLSTQ